MVLFLLMISFILHIVTIVAIVFVYKKFQHLKSNDLQDMMEIFDVYLDEIKTENKRLQEQLDASSQHIDSTSYKTTKSVYSEFLPVSETLNDKQSNNDTISAKNKVDLETSFEAKVLQLFHQGYSEDDIARQLNSGKTEVALIINLYGKKQHKS